METTMSPADMAAVMNNDDNRGCSWFLIILFLFAFMGSGFGFNRNGDFGQYATAASQQLILFGQQFQNIDNKIDRLANGLADSTYALNNTIINEGRNLQNMGYQNTLNINGNIGGVKDKLAECCCENRLATANLTAHTDRQTAAIIEALHADGLKTRAMMQANEIQNLRDKVSALEADNRMCGVVRYPMTYAYSAGPSPFCGCNCNNNI